MLSPGRGLRRASVDEMARAPERLGWKVTATLESLSEVHELATWVEGDGARRSGSDHSGPRRGRVRSAPCAGGPGAGDLWRSGFMRSLREGARV